MLQLRPGWRTKMIINGFGAVCTAVVVLVFAITKFRDGAWIVVLVIPVLAFRLLGHPSPLSQGGRPAVTGKFGAPPASSAIA